MEELIKQYNLMCEFFESVDLNIIISANNTVLVEQTKKRMKKDLATDSEEGADDACIKGNVFSWTSGTKESNVSVGDLCMDICDNKIEMIVMCAHPKRMKYLHQMIERLSSSRNFGRKINIWIDEADKSINLWSKFEDVLSKRIINQVTLVSATFDSVLSKYKSLIVLPYLKTHAECYRGLKDMNRIDVNHVAKASEYVKHTITTYSDALVKPGMRAFIPGDSNKSSHDEIADFLHKMGFVVIIINGERKEILVPDEEKAIDLRCYFTMDNGDIPNEFNSQLAKLYKDNKWSRFPLAITGFYCIERGVTFQCGSEEGVHDGFLFDYGIIPPIVCKSEAYQTTARMFGNVGHLPEYKAVDIYTSSVMFKNIEKQEEIATNIARIVAEQGIERVDKRHIKEAQNFEIESKYDLYVDEFASLEESNKFMIEHGCRKKTEKSLKIENGFYLSTTTKKSSVLNYDDVKKEMSSWSKTSNFDMKKANKEKPYSRLITCYKKMDDPTSVVFIPRVLVPK